MLPFKDVLHLEVREKKQTIQAVAVVVEWEELEDLKALEIV